MSVILLQMVNTSSRRQYFLNHPHGNITDCGAPAFTNFQCHLIAHIDYVSQWQKILFQPHAIFPEFAAKAQLSWSKNVHEEHDAPWQIVLGPKPSSMCVY